MISIIHSLQVNQLESNTYIYLDDSWSLLLIYQLFMSMILNLIKFMIFEILQLVNLLIYNLYLLSSNFMQGNANKVNAVICI